MVLAPIPVVGDAIRYKQAVWLASNPASQARPMPLSREVDGKSLQPEACRWLRAAHRSLLPPEGRASEGQRRGAGMLTTLCGIQLPTGPLAALMRCGIYSGAPRAVAQVGAALGQSSVCRSADAGLVRSSAGCAKQLWAVLRFWSDRSRWVPGVRVPSSCGPWGPALLSEPLSQGCCALLSVGLSLLVRLPCGLPPTKARLSLSGQGGSKVLRGHRLGGSPKDVDGAASLQCQMCQPLVPVRMRRPSGRPCRRRPLNEAKRSVSVSVLEGKIPRANAACTNHAFQLDVGDTDQVASPSELRRCGSRRLVFFL